MIFQGVKLRKNARSKYGTKKQDKLFYVCRKENSIHDKFLGLILTKKGNKSAGIKIFNSAFSIVSRKNRVFSSNSFKIVF